MAASATSSAGEGGDRAPILPWGKERKVWLHLAAFLLFSAVIHASGFYLFKVVYPPPVRVEPEPDSVSIMDASDPASREVLQRIGDRTVYLVPPSGQSDVRVDIDGHRVRYLPAFHDVEVSWEPPGTVGALFGELDAPHPQSIPSHVETVLSGDLASRAIAPWSILEDYLESADEVPEFRAEIEVSPEGAVRVLRVESGYGPEESESLARAVEFTLRFLGAGAASTGWIEVRPAT